MTLLFIYVYEASYVYFILYRICALNYKRQKHFERQKRNNKNLRKWCGKGVVELSWVDDFLRQSFDRVDDRVDDKVDSNVTVEIAVIV